MEPLNISIKMFQGKEGLSVIKDDWRHVTNSMGDKRFYHLHHWYESYINTIESDEAAVYFFLIYRGNRPIAVFPLKRVKKKLFGIMFNALEIPDHPHIDLSDFIFEKADENAGLLTSLINYLNKKSLIDWDVILLPHLLEESPVFHSFTVPPYPFVIYEPAGRCDYITCSPNEKTYSKLSKNFRGNLRKARNKLFREKEVEFVSARKGAELFRCFEEFLDVESSGWKGEKGTKTAIKHSSGSVEFYRQLLEKYSENNGCEINLLKIHGECIAGQFCLLVDDTIYILKIGYNEKYAQLAPGNMLLEKLIQRASNDEKIKYINLTTGSHWHKDWKPHSFKVVRVYIFNKTHIGLLGFILAKAKKHVLPIYRRYSNQ
ncbi:MAG: GNAT family N-acetyltransferase [Nitrospirota bacterium]